MENTIRLVLVDDHQMVLQGLSAVFSNLPGFEIAKTFQDGNELIDEYHLINPSVILMDVHMPTINGFDCAEMILRKDISAKILMLSMEVKKPYIEKSKKLGAKGYVSKNATIEHLAMAIKEVFMGNEYYNVEVQNTSMK